MNAITTKMVFEFDSRLNEIATIEENCNGIWAFTTNRGYNGWEGDGYKSFDSCYNALKKYEKNLINELKYQ